ncbi:unnamed protein product, partial [Polarella glacialis]
ARKNGRVGIVTLAKRPWLTESARIFLPGLDLEKLLDELQIPVFYAFEHVSRRVASFGTPNSYVAAKRNAMSECLAQLFGEAKQCSSAMSIGDSEIELLAIQELMSELAMSRFSTPLESPLQFCKTVLLRENPSLVQLQRQIESLANSLGSLVDHPGDLSLELGTGRRLRLRNHLGPNLR